MIWLTSGNVHIEKEKQIFEIFPLFTNFQDNKIVFYHLPGIPFKYYELLYSNIFGRL